MIKVNWELITDGTFGRDFDWDELDYIAEKVKEGEFSGQIFVEIKENK